jgi:Tfp pilus assembly protein PilV
MNITSDVKSKKQHRGQSMFEVVLALFIITMIIVAVVILSTNSIANSLFSRSKTQASRYSQEAVEWLRNERETNSEDFITATNNSVYCLNTNPPDFSKTGACSSTELISGTIFKRQVTFTTSDVFSKSIINATVVTSWNDPKGYHEARAVTEFSDIREN